MSATWSELCSNFEMNVKRVNFLSSTSCINYFQMGCILCNLRARHKMESRMNPSFVLWWQFLMEFRKRTKINYTQQYFSKLERFSNSARNYQKVLSLGLSPTNLSKNLGRFLRALEKYPEFKEIFKTA